MNDLFTDPAMAASATDPMAMSQLYANYPWISLGNPDACNLMSPQYKYCKISVLDFFAR